MMTKNKQRLTMLTRREVAAADTGGVLDEQIVEQRLRDRLRASGNEFDADRILDVLKVRVGWYRQLKSHKDIAQREITKQARDTAAVIDELMARLMNMHPDVYAHACEWMLKQKKEMAHSVMKRVLGEDLLWMKLALESAAEAMPKGKGGRPSEGERDTAYREVYRALLEHCRDGVALVSARELAAGLLADCGVVVPEDDRERERIIKDEKK